MGKSNGLGGKLMKYQKLGNSNLNVSRICMGCMGFGNAAGGQHSWTIDEEETRTIIKRGLELGINFYDTAIAYQNGTSEQYVGKALRDFAKREDLVVATKFTPRTQEELEQGISGQKHIENYLNQSLKNLGMDYIDLYIYHMWDYHTPMEEIMEGLHNAVKTGKVRTIGISNCFAWQLAKANYHARANGLTEFVSIQGHYNLIAREEEREMIPFCTSENIAVTPYSALAGGRLSKHPGETSKRLEEDSYAKFKYDLTAETDRQIINRVAELADQHGVSMTEISLAWLLTKVTSPVVGATKLSHVEGAAKSVDLQLTEEETDYLEELYIPHKLVGVMAQNGKQKGGNVV
jgi:aryl-alcohol dehydrogenase-like predicted oxidoreductase